jgi:hypothetical protein
LLFAGLKSPVFAGFANFAGFADFADFAAAVSPIQARFIRALPIHFRSSISAS